MAWQLSHMHLSSSTGLKLLREQISIHFRYFCAMTDNEDSTRKRACSSSLTIGTHNGTFHCDEVLACFFLKQLPEYKHAEIMRSRDVNLLREKCDIIVDVGGVFDHKQKFYDHHQNEFQDTFSSLNPELGTNYKIRLSSAGLVYNFYGMEVLGNILKRQGINLSPKNMKLVFLTIYRNFICEIDAIDNGVQMFENGEPLYNISTHLSARIGSLNPSWEEENVNIDERFQQAMEVAGQEFITKVISIGSSWINARDHVRSAIERSKNIHESGEILYLQKFCPWKLHLFELEKEYCVEGIAKLIIFSENENSWRVAGVPTTPNSFLGRKFLPRAWRGLRDKELSTVAGIPNLIFVHYNGFIGGASTKEAAIAMAIKSIQMLEED